MIKMKLKHFLLVFFSMVFLFYGIGNAYAQECDNAGEVIGSDYCDAYGELKPLKNSDEGCLNSYECGVGECIEGICQAGRFSSIDGGETFLGDIWEFFSGEQCNPNFDIDYFCQGTVAFLCGENHVWEEKGQIQGVCGFSVPSSDSGGSGSPRPKIVIYSPKNVVYSSTRIFLEVIDIKKIAKYWGYSLNQGPRITFKPNITIIAREGSNYLEIYASRFSTFSSYSREGVSFNVLLSSSANICGDGVCQVSESCGNCERDCGVCLPANLGSYCGDNVCDADESSTTCSEDCIPKVRKDRMGLFYTIVILLLASIGLLGFVVVKRVKNIIVGKGKKPKVAF
mgnify:FL=1